MELLVKLGQAALIVFLIFAIVVIIFLLVLAVLYCCAGARGRGGRGRDPYPRSAESYPKPGTEQRY